MSKIVVKGGVGGHQSWAPCYNWVDEAGGKLSICNFGGPSCNCMINAPVYSHNCKETNVLYNECINEIRGNFHNCTAIHMPKYGQVYNGAQWEKFKLFKKSKVCNSCLKLDPTGSFSANLSLFLVRYKWWRIDGEISVN